MDSTLNPLLEKAERLTAQSHMPHFIKKTNRKDGGGKAKVFIGSEATKEGSLLWRLRKWNTSVVSWDAGREWCIYFSWSNLAQFDHLKAGQWLCWKYRRAFPVPTCEGNSAMSCVPSISSKNPEKHHCQKQLLQLPICMHCRHRHLSLINQYDLKNIYFL